jgi:DNA-binding SARP family transcriptional activator
MSTLGLDVQTRVAALEAPSTCALVLLRGFALQRQGRSVDLPLAGQRLVAFLALHGRPLHRSFVAGGLWTEASEERAQAALRTTLWRIRKRAVEIVSSSASGVTLGPDVVVDLREAGQCAQRALRERGMPRTDDLTFLCDTGDLLPDWYDDWLVIERERFRLLRLGALEALCEDLSAQGRYVEATQAGIAAVAADPLRESAYRGLVRAHLAAGNPGEALREYHLFRRLLRDQLGLEPSARMSALVSELLGGVTER